MMRESAGGWVGAMGDASDTDLRSKKLGSMFDALVVEERLHTIAAGRR